MSGWRFEPTLDNGMVYASSMLNRNFNIYVDVNYGKHKEMAVFIIRIMVIFLRYIVRKKCQKKTFPTPLPTINIGAYR